MKQPGLKPGIFWEDTQYISYYTSLTYSEELTVCLWPSGEMSQEYNFFIMPFFPFFFFSIDGIV